MKTLERWNKYNCSCFCVALQYNHLCRFNLFLTPCITANFMMHLESFDSERLEEIKTSWLSSLPNNDHDVYEAEYSQLFDIIRIGKSWGELDNRFNTPIYQAIVDGNKKVWAIVHIVQSRHGSATWIKLMDIYISPEIDINKDTESNTKKRLDVFIAALLGIFSLTKNMASIDTFKIYGRTDSLVAFLRGMHDGFSTIDTIGTIKGIKVSIEGRWLVFRAM
jgi:hypothetical protein